MQSRVYEEIGHIANEIRSIEGVVGIALFGSYSRGDFDEGSDVDLLVVFRSRETLREGLSRIYRTSARSDLFLQIICLTLDETKGSPLLDSVLREGKIYHGEDELRGLPKERKPYALVTYSTANLSPKKRTLVAQKLEGRAYHKYRYDGLIQKMGGYKVGRGVAIIPAGELRTLTEFLDKKKIQHTIRYVWI